MPWEQYSKPWPDEDGKIWGTTTVKKKAWDLETEGLFASSTETSDLEHTKTDAKVKVTYVEADIPSNQRTIVAYNFTKSGPEGTYTLIVSSERTADSPRETLTPKPLYAENSEGKQVVIGFSFVEIIGQS